MKKLLLALVASPLVVMAQSANTQPTKITAAAKVNTLRPHGEVVLPSPVRIGTGAVSAQPVRTNSQLSFSTNAAGIKLTSTKLGTTTYDLQSNGSIARRIQTYSGGKMSVVWTNSNLDADQSFTDRGTAYVTFDGTQWSTKNSSRFERLRAGWPNISAITEQGVTKEVILSHYADAATSTASGGFFMMKNSKIGQPDFTTFFERNIQTTPTGSLWPRIAVTSHYIHVISVYNDNRVMDSIRNPIVYNRWNIDSGKFDISDELLPGYNHSRYAQGSADEYAIDARGNNVAILMGGSAQDVALFKSTDEGNNWTKTIVDTFAHAPYDGRIDTPFDTAWSNDGTGTVILDANGVAHVFYSKMRVLNETQGDSSFTIFFDNSGITYWNESTHTKQRVGGCIDYDGDGALSFASNTFQTASGYGNGHQECSYPTASIDNDGNLYMAYIAPHELDVNNSGDGNYRHEYICYLPANSTTWSIPQDITPTYDSLLGSLGKDNMFGCLSRDADSYLHFEWMQDPDPGLNLVNTSLPINTNDIRYQAISTSNVLNNKIGFFSRLDVGLNETVNGQVHVGDVYPNPANSAVQISVNLEKGGQANLKVYDMVGNQVADMTQTMASGNNLMKLDVTNLKAGVYFCRFTANGSSDTQKLVIER
jgi:hypothetical protein